MQHSKLPQSVTEEIINSPEMNRLVAQEPDTDESGTTNSPKQQQLDELAKKVEELNKRLLQEEGKTPGVSSVGTLLIALGSTAVLTGVIVTGLGFAMNFGANLAETKALSYIKQENLDKVQKLMESSFGTLRRVIHGTRGYTKTMTLEEFKSIGPLANLGEPVRKVPATGQERSFYIKAGASGPELMFVSHSHGRGNIVYYEVGGGATDILPKTKIEGPRQAAFFSALPEETFSILPEHMKGDFDKVVSGSYSSQSTSYRLKPEHKSRYIFHHDKAYRLGTPDYIVDQHAMYSKGSGFYDAPVPQKAYESISEETFSKLSEEGQRLYGPKIRGSRTVKKDYKNKISSHLSPEDGQKVTDALSEKKYREVMKNLTVGEFSLLPENIKPDYMRTGGSYRLKPEASASYVKKGDGFYRTMGAETLDLFPDLSEDSIRRLIAVQGNYQRQGLALPDSWGKGVPLFDRKNRLVEPPDHWKTPGVNWFKDSSSYFGGPNFDDLTVKIPGRTDRVYTFPAGRADLSNITLDGQAGAHILTSPESANRFGKGWTDPVLWDVEFSIKSAQFELGHEVDTFGTKLLNTGDQTTYYSHKAKDIGYQTKKYGAVIMILGVASVLLGSVFDTILPKITRRDSLKLAENSAGKEFFEKLGRVQKDLTILHSRRNNLLRDLSEKTGVVAEGHRWVYHL